MPILKYVPPKKEIIDHRTPEGGYYVAKCEVCETEFYPARSNAKYCCYNCGLIAHRTAVANGTAVKRKPGTLKKGGVIPSKKEKKIDYTKISYDELRELIEAIKISGSKIPPDIAAAFKTKYAEKFLSKPTSGNSN